MNLLVTLNSQDPVAPKINSVASRGSMLSLDKNFRIVPAQWSGRNNFFFEVWIFSFISAEVILSFEFFEIIFVFQKLSCT